MATRPIVVGVDGSEESLRAVEWAAMEAARRRSPLRIVSAPAMPPRMHAQLSRTTVANALRGLSARALGAALTRSEEVAPGLLIDTGLLSGPPALAVTDCGSGASMLVVGARGAGGFAALVLGSVSRYAATHAPCPVVVVRAGTGAVYREIAVGIRDPEDSTAALAFAFEEAALRHADLVAVHAIQTPDPRQVSAEVAAQLAEVLDGWREKYPKVRVRQDVVDHHPGQVLASYSARSDLVVIGRRGTDDAVPSIGAVRHAVLNHASGPVAVVPATD